MCSLTHYQKCLLLHARIKQTDQLTPIMKWTDEHYKRRLTMSARALALLERAEDAAFEKYLKARNEDQEARPWFI